MAKIEHKTVLKAEVLQALDPKPGKTYLDATFGGGGHSRAILEKELDSRIIGLDWDKKSLKIISEEFEQEFGKRVKFVWTNFSHVYRAFKKNKLEKVDGVLADFGTSQHQIFNTQGFSFSKRSLLDMRFSKAHFKTTAAEVVNTFEKRALANIFFQYGGEKLSNKVADLIISQRKESKILYTDQLAEIVLKVYNSSFSKKYRYKTHPATKVFQALRIFVNDEIKNIELFLNSCLEISKPGANLAFISFHSLEDSAVKNFFNKFEKKNKLEIITKKPIIPTLAEQKDNPSSRSAKLRVAKVL